MEFRQDEYRATNTTLQLLLQDAYGVDARQIAGAPAWVESQGFDIDAKIDGATYRALRQASVDQLKTAQRNMLQSLLAERFALTLHRDTKLLPIYSLVIAKHGIRLKPTRAGDTYADGEKWPDGAAMGPHTVSYSFYFGNVEMKGQGASIDMLVDRLTQKFADRLGRKIVDHTGLTGNYDFELEFRVPWSNNIGRNGSLQTEASEEVDGYNQSVSSEQSLFTAMQDQLGL